MRAGKGKLRNRRYRSRRGPLVVYSGANVPLIKALRNVPGVEVAHVSRLNLLQLAPGGHVGRFVIWTEGAFQELNRIFGSQTQASTQKKGYTLPYSEVTNPDIASVINSNQIQSAVRAAKTDRVLHTSTKHNPLNNTKALDRVNPNARLVREAARRANEERRAARAARLAQKRGLTPAEKKVVRERKANSRKWISNVNGYLQTIAQNAQQEQINNQKLERQIE